MSQSADNYTVANGSGATVRAAINADLQALNTNNSGGAAPTATAHMWWKDTTNNQLWMRNAANGAWILVGTFDETNNLFTPAALQPQCRLVKSGSALILQPCNGNRIVLPNGKALTLPSGGVSVAAPTSVTLNGVAASSLTNGTTYYVYAYNNSGAVALDFSATGYGVDSTSGLPVKSGDSSRLLVGMVRPVGGAWVDSATQIFVISYWSPQPKGGVTGLASTTGTSSSSYTELNSSLRVEFLAFSGRGVEIAYNGGAGVTTGTGYVNLGVDGNVQDVASIIATAQASGVAGNITVSLADGYHYLSMLATNTGGTTNVIGGGGGLRATWNATVLG